VTLDQIEEVRLGHKPSLSLQQAAHGVGIAFEQCTECNGNGWTKATLLASMSAIEALAKACPNEPVPIQYERCQRCNGSGGWLL
jgi:DnaJ-class molecular chaperone